LDWRGRVAWAASSPGWGFALAFPTFAANLILADMEMLASMVNNSKRPVQFVFAGKAHPNDTPGKRVLQQVAEMM
jgi:hypothetical protein